MFMASSRHNPPTMYRRQVRLQLVPIVACGCARAFFWLPFSSCQADLLNRVLFFYVCVHCVCVSKAWCKHNIRRDVYCNVSVWCQLSWAASCLEKRMTVWLFDDNVGLASLFLSSASQKNADIKCLMLACTTDVQIKTSPVRHDFSSSSFFFLVFLHFWQYICCFCCFHVRFKFYLSPPFFKSLDCFYLSLSRFLLSFFFLLLFLLKSESRQKIHSGVAYEFKNNSFPLEYILGF